MGRVHGPNTEWATAGKRQRSRQDGRQGLGSGSAASAQCPAPSHPHPNCPMVAQAKGCWGPGKRGRGLARSTTRASVQPWAQARLCDPGNIAASSGLWFLSVQWAHTPAPGMSHGYTWEWGSRGGPGKEPPRGVLGSPAHSGPSGLCQGPWGYNEPGPAPLASACGPRQAFPRSLFPPLEYRPARFPGPGNRLRMRQAGLS